MRIFGRIRELQKRNVPTNIKRQLVKLNFGHDGSMLETYLNLDDNAVITWIENQDKVLSWTINDEECYSVFYTRIGYRQMGLATRLVKRLIKSGEMLDICKHSDEATALGNRAAEILRERNSKSKRR